MSTEHRKGIWWAEEDDASRARRTRLAARLSRRTFLGVGGVAVLGALTACGEEDDDTIVEDVTRIPVEGAPTELPTPDAAALTAEAEQNAGGQDGGDQDGGDQGGAGTFRLEGYDIGWRTADQPGPQVQFAVPPGATIELVNGGAAPHNFSIDAKNNDAVPDLGISVDMPVGETVTAQIPGDAQPGDYYFYCNVPGHEQVGMHGVMTVDPNVTLEGAATPAAEATPAQGGAAAGPFALEAYDIGWRTADQPGPQVQFTIAPGTTIEITNTGAAPHNFTVDAKNNDGLPDLGISVDFAAGETVSVEIPADAAPGTYYFYCNVPGHEQVGMHGEMTLDPNAAPAGAAPSDAGGEEAAQGEDAAAGATTFQLEGYDIGWRTADQPGPQVQFTVAPGTTIELVNGGAAPHNFSVDAKNNDGLPDLGISVDMPAGQTVTAQIPADAAPGTYYFYCNVPGHEQVGMHGEMTIQ